MNLALAELPFMPYGHPLAMTPLKLPVCRADARGRHPYQAAWLTSVLTAMLMPCGVHSQPDDMGDRVRSLATVEVIGQTPLPGGVYQSRDQYPGHVQLEDDGAMERARSDNLADFMRRRLGSVSVNEIQGSPFQLDMNYRGHRLSPLLGSSQGLSVYVDGVRFNEPLGDVMNWDLLPEAAVSTLTLVPGSNPLYGLNTLGGALVLTTKSGQTHPGTEMDLSLGSFGRRRLDLGRGMQWGEGWHGYLAATLFDESGWRERSPGRLGNLFLKLGRQSGDVDWSLSLNHVGSRLTGNGLLNESLYRIDPSAGYTFSDVTRNDADVLNFSLKRILNAQDQLSVTAWNRRSRRESLNGDVNDAWSDGLQSCGAAVSACSSLSAPGLVTHTAVVNRTAMRQSGSGAGMQWTRAAMTHRLALGAEYTANHVAYDQFEQDGTFDAARVARPDPAEPETQAVALRGKSHTFSLLGTSIVALSPRTHVTVSGRWNQTRVSNDLGTPAPLHGEAFTYSRFNPAAGMTHTWSDRVNLFANLSQGTRVPTSMELGCADPARPCTLPTGLQSDPYLRQVVARTLEAGARARLSSELQLSVALFRTVSQDDIVFVRSGISQAGYFTNIGKTLRQGLELSARGRSRALQWGAHYTYLRATYESDGVLHGPLSTPEQPNRVVPGTPMAGLPRHTLKLAGDWRVAPTVLLGADLLVLGTQRVAGNESGSRPELGRLGGHAVINARASWQWDPRWQAYLRINNVTDRRHASYGAGNLDLFPAGQALQAGTAPAASRFLAPGAPRAMWIGVRYEWDQ